LRKLAAEDYVAILSDGTRLTLDAYCALLPIFEIQRYSLSDAELLSPAPDVAILLYKAEATTVMLGETFEEQIQLSSVWVRRNGEWRNVFYQETLIED